MPRFSLQEINNWLEQADKYVDAAETPVALTSLASTGATLVAPNPVTGTIAIGSNITGGAIDLYQGIRAGMKGDWANVAKNAGELFLSLIGAKAVSGLNKTAKVTKGFVLGKNPRMLGLKVAPGQVNNASRIATGTSVGLGSTSSMIELPQDNTRVVNRRYIEPRNIRYKNK